MAPWQKKEFYCNIARISMDRYARKSTAMDLGSKDNFVSSPDGRALRRVRFPRTGD